MLSRRGYTVPVEVEEETEASVEDNVARGVEGDDEEAPLLHFHFTVTRATAPHLLMVFFPNITMRTNLGVAPIRHIASIMAAAQCQHGILVVAAGLTAPAAAQLRDLESNGTLLTAFTENELMVDIYEHEKVPLHVPLTAAQKQALLKQYKLTDRHLPEMQRQDPMARYLGLVVGDVVRIHRVSPTVGYDIYYRIVVNSEDFD
jgi:DNA-directed RNA polymerase I, II, and III subunit RPABC1